MTIRQNMDAMLRMTEAFNNRESTFAEQAAKVVPDLLAEDYQEDWTYGLDRNSERPLERMPPVERIQAEIQLVRRAFPDAHYAVRDIVSNRDTAILIWEFTGTQSGEFFDREPTNRQMKVTGFEVVKFNRRGEMIGHYDNHLQTSMEVLAQAGYLDAPTLEALGFPQTPRASSR
jgi:hypothetical protein